MIDFHTYCKIHELKNKQQFSSSKIAKILSIDHRTVNKWLNIRRYKPRHAKKKISILDPFKFAIRREIELMNTPASQIYRDLKNQDYNGGKTIVEEYVSKIRPNPSEDHFILPNRWMLMLLQGKIKITNLAEDTNKVITLHELQIFIKHITKGTLSERNRALAVVANSKGIPISQISQFLMINSRTVNGYLRKYRQNGIDDFFKFRKDKIKKHENSEYQCALFSILHSPPKDFGINRTSWRMVDLHRIMREQGYPINEDSIRIIIRNAGFRFRKAKKVLTSTDPDYREKLKSITKILTTLSENESFFSIDEFGPFAVKKQGGKALTPPCEKRTVPQWQKSKGSLIITAALELSTNQMIHFYSNKKNTDEMITLLHLLISKYKNKKKLYLSWDAASWHVSKKINEEISIINTDDYQNDHGNPTVILAPLPSCAQFLNIIESVFSGMARAILHNSDYKSIEDCKIAIDQYFMDRNTYFINNPKRAGNKIWGKERVSSKFSECNNCKDPYF